MSAKQAINDKLQRSVATYLRCGGVDTNQIKKRLLLSPWVNFFLNGEHLAKLQARTWLFRALFPSFSSVLAKHTSARDNHILACNFAKYSPILNFFFTHRLSNKPFLIWLLTTPPHLKYVVALPCNLSSMTCFANITTSQGSVATYARCGGIFDIHATANLPRNHAVKKFLKSVKNWQNYGLESVPPFLAHPVHNMYIICT